MAIQNSNQQGIQKRLIPPGGTPGQIPSKKTAADYDVQWVDPPEGGGDAAEFQELTGELTFAILNALEVNKFYKITDATFTENGNSRNIPDGTAYFEKILDPPTYYPVFIFYYPDSSIHELISNNAEITFVDISSVRAIANSALQLAEQNALLELSGMVYYDDLNDLNLPAYVKFNQVEFIIDNSTAWTDIYSEENFLGYVYQDVDKDSFVIIHPDGRIILVYYDGPNEIFTDVKVTLWRQSNLVREATQEEYNALTDEEKQGMIVITDAESSGGGGSSDEGIPTGVIVIWSGASDAVPSGWALCDGTNGTPDLRDRFVLGAGVTHVVGESGGSEEVTLTVGQMPPHRHITYVARDSGSASSNKDCINAQILKGTNQWYTDSNNPVTGSSGSSQPHPNMPPYYTLAYIMKL